VIDAFENYLEILIEPHLERIEKEEEAKKQAIL
jgi:hypothetical protein